MDKQMNGGLMVTMEKQWMIDGKVFVPNLAVRQSKPTFKESHTRTTTYIDNNLHILIHMLLDHGQIGSITAFINDSIKYYLMHEKNDFGNTDH